MLTPTKHLNLELSVVRLSSAILKLLQKNKIMEYDEVLNNLKNNKNILGLFIFLESIF